MANINRYIKTPKASVQSSKSTVFIGLAVVCLLLGSLAAVVAVTRPTNLLSKAAQENPLRLGIARDASGSSSFATLDKTDIRDSATGTIIVKPISDKKKQGSHILKRDDAPWPIYLISGRVDLSQYENKHVKVYGVTYNGGSSDWYLTVNKVEAK